MTNSIGTGTVNITINVPVDERAFWGRMAAKANTSIGKFKREMTLKGLAACSKESAEELREIRRRYYGSAFLLLFIGSLAACCCGDQPLRRANVRVKQPTIRWQSVKVLRRGKWETEFETTVIA